MPSFPTDSLYKFLALSGLFLVSFCGWSRWHLNENIAKIVHELKQEEIELFSDDEYEDAKALHENQPDVPLVDFWKEKDGPLYLYELIRPGTLVSDYETYSQKRRGEMRQKWGQHDINMVILAVVRPEQAKMALESRLKRRKHVASIENLWFRVDQQSFPLWGTFWGMLIGLFALIFGFVAWYFLHQCYMDEKAELEVEKLKRELAKLPEVPEPPRAVETIVETKVKPPKKK